MEYLDNLNEEQRAAVVNTKGAALIIAGAGSGKTRVLTYRIAHLLNEGEKAHKILSLTFTNKAAREMKERIADVVGAKTASSLWMGTFHSIFSRILRYEAESLNYSSNFTIYDTQDSRNLIKGIVKELKLDDKAYRPNAVQSRISMAKNNLLTAETYAQSSVAISADKQQKMPQIHQIYKFYEARCKKADAMDFDDLLLNTNILFRDNPDILKKYQDKFNYILVDEYQDTNFSQYLIVKKLASEHNNICVVGDDAQSIYSFRGAKIENILKFQNDYQGCKLYKLERNYRSTPTIVNAANSVIAKNTEQLKKASYSKNAEGDKIKIIRTLTDKEEAYKVAQEIKNVHDLDNSEYKDTAILYRTNSQSRAFEESLRKLSVPYKVFGGLSFYQRKEIKDILAYIRLLTNPNDEEAIKRIINYPKRAIGNTTMDKIKQYALMYDKSIWYIVNNIKTVPYDFTAGVQKKLASFADLINTFAVRIEEDTAYQIANGIAQASGLVKEITADKTPEGISRLENLQELFNSIKDYTQTSIEEGKDPKIAAFIEDIALLTDQDKNKGEEYDFISLMTTHSAKGLEFKNVFIVGLEEELFPSSMAGTTPQGLEEERRVFYVALTRAEKRLFLSYTKNRFKWGNLVQCKPSRFIKEIDSQYIENPNEREAVTQATGGFMYKNKAKTKASFEIPNRRLKPLSSTDSIQESTGDSQHTNPNNLEPGNIIEHQRFGRGTILNIEGANMNKKASIKFENFGEKQLLLKFAKLKIIK
ncbi:MAG: UvrD-helicase domain-containing protein [Marinifilaceae bacterium]